MFRAARKRGRPKGRPVTEVEIEGTISTSSTTKDRVRNIRRSDAGGPYCRCLYEGLRRNSKSSLRTLAQGPVHSKWGNPVERQRRQCHETATAPRQQMVPDLQGEGKQHEPQCTNTNHLSDFGGLGCHRTSGRGRRYRCCFGICRLDRTSGMDRSRGRVHPERYVTYVKTSRAQPRYGWAQRPSTRKLTTIEKEQNGDWQGQVV